MFAAKIQNDLRILTERLARINDNLARKRNSLKFELRLKACPGLGRTEAYEEAFKANLLKSKRAGFISESENSSSEDEPLEVIGLRV